MKGSLFALLGAAIGGVVGYFVCEFLSRQGIVALAVPGGLLGLGAGVAKNSTIAVPIICGITATALGVFAAAQIVPFVADDSLGFFIRHVHESSPATQLMIVIGGVLGFYIPLRNRARSAN